MVAMITVILMMLGLAFWQGLLLVRRKRWGELAVATTIWLFATAYAALVMSPLRLLNPNKIIIAFLERFYSFIFYQ